MLVNGKSFADAIRANPANPAEDGRCYPVDGAPEWHRGAGAMANDPRDRKRNNAIINFVKPKSGATKAARELAPVSCSPPDVALSPTLTHREMLECGCVMAGAARVDGHARR